MFTLNGCYITICFKLIHRCNIMSKPNLLSNIADNNQSIDLANMEFCTNFLATFKSMSDSTMDTLIGMGINAKKVSSFHNNNSLLVTAVIDKIGFFITPALNYYSWIERHSDFSYGDIITSLRNTEALNNHAGAVDLIKAIEKFESIVQSLSKFMPERTKFARSLMENIHRDGLQRCPHTYLLLDSAS